MFRRKLLYALCVVTLVIVNALYVNYEFFVMLVLVLMIPLLSWFLYFLSSLGMRINLYNSLDTVTQGDRIKLIIYLIRKIPLPVSRGVLQLHLNYSNDEEMSNLNIRMADTNQEEGTSLVLNTKHCGVFTISAYRYSWCDYTGIFRSRRKMKGSRSIIVMPECLRPNTTLYHRQQKEYECEVLPGCGHEGDEVVDVRAYREGDPLNRVHWKLSTRSENMIVRDYNLPDQKCNLILIDLSTLEQPDFRDRLDHIYQAAYSYGNYYAERLVESQFVVWNDNKHGMQRIPFQNIEMLQKAMAILMNIACSEDNYQRMTSAMKANGLNLKEVAVLITAQSRDDSAYNVMNVSQDDIQKSLDYMCIS